MGILSIDTSCYTTSVAFLEGERITQQRTVLKVPPGARGLRQSEALFQHLGNLPPLLKALAPGTIEQVAASTRPNPTVDSYLPVFKAGTTVAQSIAASLNCPFFATSHQEGHLWAGFWSVQKRPEESWLAFHLSGGTTQLLRLGSGLTEIEELGRGMDLHAGQFIDRVGVSLGLSFPAGPALEVLAQKGTPGAIVLPAPVRGYDLSFGGPESAAQRLREKGAAEADLALAVILAIGRGVAKVLAKAIGETGINKILFVGGVAANQILRDFLQQRLAREGAELFFADPALSTDNAVGVAVAAKEAGPWKD